ncbi:RNA polymerase sigma factor, sigma-70 family [Dyadobacter koreensis]|uniref:RNA polymerase sigma factor, sigma-70 family n=1 Tax=Dyadobacter koreensis TaxID=408657 RepID=A0A1H6QXB3_9BACT|nr:sigma-70 family RNA polymerase sigma factor [Dyadobacter koreensis]SEI45594.1 RNA polymerase sigma factor, sigma-70 family [Dyadobacter koreensis]
MESYLNNPNILEDNHVPDQGSVKTNPLDPLTPEENTEQKKWLLLKERDEQALAWLYEAYGKLLHNYGFRLVSDKELVKDTVQDVFVQLWNTAEKLPDVNSPKGYLIVAVRRELLKRITRQRKFSDQFVENPESSVEDQFIEFQTNEMISDGLAGFVKKLPSRQREIIFLKYYSALSTEQIATVMQLTPASVYKLAYKAIDNLKELCAGWKSLWIIFLIAISGF